MLYKPYGNSGMKVSAVGFGGMRFDTAHSEQHNADLVQYAFSRGINYFDTAPTYCESQSPKIFGQAFKHMKGKYFVSTKKRPMESDTAQNVVDHIKRACETLNRDYIDVFHIWCIQREEHLQLALRPDGMYDGLQKAKALGLIRNIGFSSHQRGGDIRGTFERAKFDGVLLGMNILNFPFRWDGVAAAIEHGAGVAVMNPLYGGMISKYQDKLNFLKQDGETPVQTALRFAIGTPHISTALIGLGEKAHIDMACDVAEREDIGISAERLDAIRANLNESMTEACTGCGYCRQCPKEIDVPAFMLYYNPHHVFGVTEAEMIAELPFERQFGVTAASKAKPGECIGCGACEKACTQKLPIIERLRTIQRWGY